MADYDLAFDSGVGVDGLAVFDIEHFEGDLTACYSPIEVQKFCRVLGIRPIELFADSITEPPISTDELVHLIHAECRLRGITLEQFEDKVGWQLSGGIEPPERLLEGISVDGLQWLCRELRVDWLRVLLSL